MARCASNGLRALRAAASLYRGLSGVRPASRCRLNALGHKQLPHHKFAPISLLATASISSIQAWETLEWAKLAAHRVDRDGRLWYALAMRYASCLLLSISTLALVACEASYHAKEVRTSGNENGLTAGKAQREIKEGMPSASVAEALGSPNVVSTDGAGREVWVYDRMSQNVTASGSSWFVSAGSRSTSQRTLTIVVKFDQNGRVRDLAYHQSSF